MSRRSLCFLMLLLLTPMLCGCGTLANVKGCDRFLLMGFPNPRPTTPFGGLHREGQWVGGEFDEWGASGPLRSRDLSTPFGWVLYSTIAFPLNLAGDVVTLPFVLVGAFEGSHKRWERPDPRPVPLPADAVAPAAETTAASGSSR